MRMNALLLVTFSILSVRGSDSLYQVGKIGSLEWPANVNRDYRLLLPKNLNPQQTYPLVVYLHGSGSRASDNMKQLQEELPKLLAMPRNQEAFPCFVLVPQCRDGEGSDGHPNNWVKWKNQNELPPAQWEESAAEATAQLKGAMRALDEVLVRHAVDTNRMYLVGVSMGGSGAWNWARHEPRRFAAIVPICGLSETRSVAALKYENIWTFHGDRDPVVPIRRTREMALAMEKSGHPIQFMELKGAGHNIAQRVFAENDQALLRWLFTQRRNEPLEALPRTESVADGELFEKKIRPLLAENCFECHGDKKQKGGLRLDSRAAMLTGGDTGPSIVPGDPEKSLLLTAIQYRDENLLMPPKRKLAAEHVAALSEWIKRGAPWPQDTAVALKPIGETGFSPEMTEHWAYQPIRKPPVPTIPTGSGGVNEIDAFVIQKLNASGLQLSPRASNAALLRRVNLDLIGLPPTQDRQNAFLADGSAPAFAQAVDQLLASLHYGERWGRHWLDVARYADSNGSEVDHAMAHAWRYRDYVVKAFNEDKPFNQFVLDQLAGDLLPNMSNETLAATGFIMLGPKALADLNKPKLLADVVDEQIDTMCRALMGMTMGCARCHDHKFDPLPTADYYALAGIFNSTRTLDVSKRVATWTTRPLGGTERHTRDLNGRIAALHAERANMEKGKARPALGKDAAYLVIEAERFARGNVRVDTDSLGKGIGVIRTQMEYPDHIEYEFELPIEGEYQLELCYASKEMRAIQLLINGNLEEMNAASEVTGDWAPAAQQWFVQGTYRFKAGMNTLAFHREGPIPLFDKLLIGRVSAEPHWRNIKPSIDGAKADADKAQRLKKIDQDIAAVSEELARIPAAMAPFDGPVSDAPILVRGNPSSHGAIVARGFPRIIKGLYVAKPNAQKSGRLELAEWLTHPGHPLTARVIVNRVWLWHFGEGLVRSPDNFGLRGEKPSHPELLDWLAMWFMENGWSIKKLNRLICNSATYQQAVLGHAPATDAENLLLSGFPRQRLDTEVLRDCMLSASGRLDLQIGGSLMTVLDRTYANGGNAPADIAKQMHYESTRRSLYLPVIRNAIHDFFAAFDYPDPGMLTGKRARTTVAPQALFLMNSPFVVEQASHLASQLAALAHDEVRAREVYQRILSRLPDETESKQAVTFVLQEEIAWREAGNPEPRIKAWQRFCHALLMSNEFLYQP